ncbi:F-box domain [Arabidopsis suecica]|uniref:F-box domain n=1 Tax=Arabidopsis suecica TaxID=45249 RepID=A0A8T2AHY8_ARASU|nr:F-box domain [Arabidopsis suecica]
MMWFYQPEIWIYSGTASLDCPSPDDVVLPARDLNLLGDNLIFILFRQRAEDEDLDLLGDNFVLPEGRKRFVIENKMIGWDKAAPMVGTTISELPDDLLIKILSYLSTEDAVVTMLLSKRWQSIWKMVPQLTYMDSDYKHRKKGSVWWFMDQSLQLHKAPVIESLIIELGARCPVHNDVGKFLVNVVKCRAHKLRFKLSWLSKPISLPESFYICDKLVSLYVSDKILVNVPSPVCLPSLKTLSLESVVYKDEDSLVRFLSENSSSKIINSGNSCSIENEPRLDYALVGLNCYLDDKFMASLSSVMYLKLYLSSKTDPYCTSIKFSQLITCTIRPIRLQWLEPFMHFLQNSPKLKVLRIDTSNIRHEGFPRLFNRQSSFPECLSAHLEIFEWKQYGGHYERKKS